MEHICSCAEGIRAHEVCPAPHELSDGTHHWWSGWPGAYCMGCGASDPVEECMAGCECECHAEFWKMCEQMNFAEDFDFAEHFEKGNIEGLEQLSEDRNT